MPSGDEGRWEAEVIEVADRASDLIRDQVRALLGRANLKAVEIERQAEKEADAIRGRARRAAESVLAAVEGLELDLEARVADIRSQAGTQPEAPAVPAELMAASEAVNAQAELLRQSLADRSADHASAPSSPAVARDEPEGPDGLAIQAQRRVTGETDVALIEMYANAERQAGTSGDKQYWSTLKDAVVAEVKRRETFAAGLDPGAGLKRAQRKEQRLALEAIRAAVDSPPAAGD